MSKSIKQVKPVKPITPVKTSKVKNPPQRVQHHHHSMDNINIHLYHHHDSKIMEVISNELSSISKQLLLIIKNQKHMSQTLADIQAKNQELADAVTAEDTVIDSAVTLITGFGQAIADLKQQLADAIASNNPQAIQAVLDAMDATKTDIDAKKQQLADAVVANTPAA